MMSWALSSRSGGIDGRPIAEYISSNVRSSCRSASSASRLISRMGWVAGTRFPGGVTVSSPICESCSPRMVHRRSRAPAPVDPHGGFFSTLLERLRGDGLELRGEQVMDAVRDQVRRPADGEQDGV